MRVEEFFEALSMEVEAFQCASRVDV